MTATFRVPRRVLAASTALATAAALALPAATAAPPGPAAPPAAAARAVAGGFTEHFDGTTLPSGWNPVEGGWKVENGRLVGTSTDNQLSRITFGTPLRDYRIEATVRFESVRNSARWAALGLDIAPSGAVPWSIATMRSGSTATNGLEFAQRTATNSWNVLDTTAAPFAAGVGRDVRIAVEVHGSRAVWLFDGKDVMRTTVLPRSATGGQGLVVNDSEVSFDDVSLIPLERESYLRKPGAPVAVIAHRGGSWAAPENTAATDEIARRSGSDWIENDVQPSKDGVPMILHDTTVDRTTDGTGAIRSLTSTQLAGLDAGSWFAPAYAGQRVPTLAQQLDGLKSRGGDLLLEIKGRHTRDEVATIVDLIRGKQMGDRVFVQSFEVDALRFTRELAPELPLGLLRSTLDADPVAISAELGLTAYNPSDGALATRPGIVADLHAAGVAVNVWTVDSASRWKALEELGVDGIITNRAAELAGWNEAYRQRSAPAASVLTPAKDQRVDRAQQLRIAVAATNADTVTLTLDGTPVTNGAAVDVTALTAGRHTIAAVVSGPGGRATVESGFDVVATPTGLAHLILTSGGSDNAVATMTTMLGRRGYDQLARYVEGPGGTGLSQSRVRLIAAEARAL